MAILNQTTKNIQNPALGATVLWRFTSGYTEGSKISSPTPLPILFIVIPIMYHEDTVAFITSTQQGSGLRAFVNKFAESKNSKSDLVLSIHERSLKMRNLTLSSLRLGITSKLVSVDFEKGTVFPLSLTPPKAGIPKSVNRILKGAEKLGFWCSEISLHEVSLILKVGF